MISSKELLLVRPWQQKKYENHKKKIQHATSVIDTKSPPFRAHVAIKLKKLQNEEERIRKIERENLILLRKLNYIMSTHWLDNYLAPQPSFLGKIGLYRPRPSTSYSSAEEMVDLLEIINSDKNTEKSSCLNVYDGGEIEAHQNMKLCKKRSKSVPPRRKSREISKPSSSHSNAEEIIRSDENSKKMPIYFPHKIAISRGSLELSVNFPSDSMVKLDRKHLGRTICKCALLN